MVCYLNRGLILEQAICNMVHEYFDALHLDTKYRNFHISVTLDHPFAELYLHDTLNAADSFPAVVISTQEDNKPSELIEMPIHTQYVSIDETDLNTIINTKDSRGKSIPGLCTVVDDETIESIKETIELHGEAKGISFRSFHKDNINIEIWAENNQLKNEIYEQLRLYITGSFPEELAKKYEFFGPVVFDASVQGHRSNNYNFDFDVALSGAHISFDVNYCIEQILIDTDATTYTDIVTEVTNYVYKG